MFTSTRQKLQFNASNCIIKGISDEGGLFIYDKLDKFTLGKNNKYIKIDDKKYRLSDDTYVYNAGEIISIYELDEKDIVNNIIE